MVTIKSGTVRIIVEKNYRIRHKICPRCNKGFDLGQKVVYRNNAKSGKILHMECFVDAHGDKIFV